MVTALFEIAWLPNAGEIFVPAMVASDATSASLMSDDENVPCESTCAMPVDRLVTLRVPPCTRPVVWTVCAPKSGLIFVPAMVASDATSAFMSSDDENPPCESTCAMPVDSLDTVSEFVSVRLSAVTTDLL